MSNLEENHDVVLDDDHHDKLEGALLDVFSSSTPSCFPS